MALFTTYTEEIIIITNFRNDITCKYGNVPAN